MIYIYIRHIYIYNKTFDSVYTPKTVGLSSYLLMYGCFNIEQYNAIPAKEESINYLSSATYHFSI